MARTRKVCGFFALAWLVAPAFAQGADLSAVRRVAVVGQNPLQLQIQTNSKVVPQSQMISDPDRLVIDIPNSMPGAALRGISVNLESVKGVRVSQFSAVPPVTRIVVDLSAPQTYSVVPNANGLLVSLGNGPAGATNSASPTPAIGWVSATRTVKVTNAPASSPRKNLSHSEIGPNAVAVQFTNGLLSIHATGATLSEVLFQVQKQTGAEIAIPSGAEQDRVAADFGPGPAAEVLANLLNGTGLNFVVVGSESDPTVLRSVLLSRKSGEATGPVASQQAYPPPEAENIPPQGQEDLTPPDSNPAPPDDNGAAQPPVQAPPDPSAPPPTQ